MKMMLAILFLAVATPAFASRALLQAPSVAPSSSVTDADVLNFAYNLECLEGQFYSCAAFGTPLPTNITGNGPAPSSCTKANLTAPVATYAAELTRDETAHVALLYGALKAAGASPVCPQVNIGINTPPLPSVGDTLRQSALKVAEAFD